MEEPPRLLSGREGLIIQGWPANELDHPKMLEWDKLLMDLAGSAFSGQVFMAMLFGILVHYPLEHLGPVLADDMAVEVDTGVDHMINDILFMD